MARHSWCLTIERFFDRESQRGRNGFVATWFHAPGHTHRQRLRTKTGDSADLDILLEIGVLGPNMIARLSQRVEHTPQIGVVSHLYVDDGSSVLLRVVDHRLRLAVADDVHATLVIANFGGPEIDAFDNTPGPADLDDI